MKVELLTIFFGEEHLQMFYRTLIPSLWQVENIPAMLNDGCEVVHRIFCPESEAKALAGYALTSKLQVEIHPGTVVPTDHDGLAKHFAESTVRGTLTVMASCDHVFGKGLWRVIKDLKPGEYLVCGHPRIELETGLLPMEDFLSRKLANNNYNLVNFCMNTIPHPMVKHGKKHPEPYWHTFQRGDHWETHFAEPPPLAFWGSPDMLEPWGKPVLFGPWEVLDHDLVQHCYARGTLRWITDSREFFWAEFTKHKKYHPAYGQTIYSGFKFDCMKHFHNLPLRWYYRG